VIGVPAALSRYIASKGSVAVDGVSLTVNAVRGAEFEVNVIPHTQAVTVIGEYRGGTAVNIEVDLLARIRAAQRPGGAV
jgi:riboflavin synthase